MATKKAAKTKTKASAKGTKKPVAKKMAKAREFKAGKDLKE